MRANTQNVQQGEQETRGVGEGRKKSVNSGMGRWGGVHRVNKMDIAGTFRKESREFEGGRFGVD